MYTPPAEKQYNYITQVQPSMARIIEDGEGQTLRSALMRFLFMSPSLSPMREADLYSTFSFPGKKNSMSSTKPAR